METYVDTKMYSIHENMAEFGCTLVGQALYSVTFMEMSYGHHASAITLAAQAAEILIKAAIAKEHPLLIFEKIPSMNLHLVSIENILEHGKTIRYSELPARLKIVTGYTLISINEFIAFGKERNKIIHCGIRDDEPSNSDLVIKFLIEIIDPLIKHFWNRSAFEECCNIDPETPRYLIEQCINRNINFRIPKDFEIDIDDLIENVDIDKYRYNED